jgi:hypothetical protein
MDLPWLGVCMVRSKHVNGMNIKVTRNYFRFQLHYPLLDLA